MSCRFKATELSGHIAQRSCLALTVRMFCHSIFSSVLSIDGWYGPSGGGLGPLLGPLWEVLVHSWDLCGRSWLAIRASVGGLGSLLGPLWVVLACSCGLRGRSGTAFWGSEGDLGKGSGRKVAQTQGISLESGPNPSGSRVGGGSGTPNRTVWDSEPPEDSYGFIL